MRKHTGRNRSEHARDALARTISILAVCAFLPFGLSLSRSTAQQVRISPIVAPVYGYVVKR